MKQQILKLGFVMTMCFIFIGGTICYSAELSFSDVQGHWAEKEIYSMANKWIILGYPDGSFKPDGNIIKTHAFLMFARINGYFDTENEVIIEQAIQNYSDELQQASITGGIGEISFLIETGVISLEDVIDLLGNGKENENLTREEAAYIYVKLLDDEKNLNRFPLVTFEDADSIQEEYLSYVEYVSKTGLMIGYNNNFDPQQFVTRAQVATILSRIDKIIYERTATKVEGLINKIDLSANILELDVAGNIQTYILSRDFSVYEKDEKISKTKLKENDLVTLYLDSGVIGSIVVNNVENIVYATYLSYSVTSEKKIIKVEINGQEYEYTLLKNVQIVNNDKNVHLDSITAGEKIEIVIVNNSVSNILVGAFSYAQTGSIEKIIIGSKSYLTIKDLYGQSHEYEVASNADFDFDGATGSIYDLRLDMEVKLTVTHNGITKIKIETLTDIEVITGQVIQILPQIYVFTVKLDDNQVQMLFLDEDETVIKTKNGLAKSIEDIKVNDLVSVYGRYEGEVFYPIQVIIY